MSNPSVEKSSRSSAYRRPKTVNRAGASAQPPLTPSTPGLAEGILTGPRVHAYRLEAEHSGARGERSEQCRGGEDPSLQRADRRPTNAACSAAKKVLVHSPENEAMTVAQLSQRAEVASHVVRYYSRQGLLTPMRHPDNQYRLYCSAHVRRLRFIQQAKALGFSLREIRGLLQDAEQGRSPCPRVRALMAARIAENRRKLDELIALQGRMEDALRRWETLPDRIPSDDSVRHLIESYDGAMTALATSMHRA